MTVKWKTFLLKSLAVMLLCQKYKLLIHIQTVLLAYNNMTVDGNENFRSTTQHRTPEQSSK
jgi:hypothetical protein